jgi:small subunit ribosomal protein S6
MGAAGQKEESMPLYELGLLLNADLESEDREAFLGEIRQLLAAEGATITKEDVWGRRNLAYQIDHKREGYYVFWQMEGPGTLIKPLEYRLRLSDQVVRYLNLNLDRELQRSRKMEQRRRQAKARKAEAAAKLAGAGAEAAREV